MTTTIRKFDSLAALSAFVESTPANGYFAGRELSSEREESPRKRDKFFGTKDYAAANELMLHGWQAGAERVRAVMTATATATNERPRLFSSVVGYAPNVGRCLTGHPLNMYNRKRVKVPARVVDIVYNCSVDHSIPAADLERAAAKLFNVVTSLERGGVRVNLWVTGCSRNKTEDYSAFAVKIKTASQPFNLLKMCYPVVHPSFFRRHLFAVVERANLPGEWRGYGFAIDGQKKLKELAAAAGIVTDNIYSYYRLKDMTESEIIKSIK